MKASLRGSLVLVVLLMAPQASSAQVPVVGQVLDRETARPVSGATIRFAQSAATAVTDSTGRFSVALPSGTHQLLLDHVAYGSHSRTLVVGATAIGLEIRVDARTIQLTELHVEALSADERERRAEGAAVRRISREQLQAASERGHDLADVLRRSASGLRVQVGQFITPHNSHPMTMLCIQASGRGPATLEPRRSSSGPPVGGVGRYRTCDMVPVFLDGVQLADAGAYLRNFGLDQLDRVEWLSAIAAASRYGQLTENTGVLLLYTRTGPR